MPSATPKQVIPPRASAGARRGGVLIAFVVVLILLQAIVLAIASTNAESQRLVPMRIDAPKAYYAAEAGMNMALAEIYANSDRDADGTIGTVSNDNIAANNPAISGISFSTVPATSIYGQTFRTTVPFGSTYRRLEFTTETLESFENYNVANSLSNVGGWVLWDNNSAVAAYPSSTFARSGTQSVDILQTTDLVHSYAITSGTWVITAYQYIPSSTTGTDHYFILMNTYNASGTKYWSTQVRFLLTNNTVLDNLPGGQGTVTTQTLIRDQWMPIVVTIDLGANTQTVTYNGNTVLSGPWVRYGGTATIAAIDLYGSTANHVYYDDIQITQNGVTPTTKITSWKMVAPTP